MTDCVVSVTFKLETTTTTHLRNMKKHLLLIPVSLLTSLTASAIVTVIEDFESAATNDEVGTLAGWTQFTDPDMDADIQEVDSNKVLRIQLPSGAINNDDAGAWISLGTSIPTSSSAATLFYQMRFEDSGARAFAGLSAASTTDLASSVNFDEVAAYAGGITSGAGFGSRDGGTTDSAGTPSEDTWYNVWLVVDNSTQTYDVYINSGTSAATAGDLLFADQAFRTGADGIPGALDKLIVLGTNNSSDATYFDNFTLDDAGVNLNYQLVPEPSTYALISGILVSLLLLRRRRN